MNVFFLSKCHLKKYNAENMILLYCMRLLMLLKSNTCVQHFIKLIFKSLHLKECTFLHETHIITHRSKSSTITVILRLRTFSIIVEID